MRLKEQLGGRMVFIDLRAEDAAGALTEIADSLAPVCRAQACGDLRGQLRQWFDAGRPGVAKGVALPHARCPGIEGNALCLARSGRGLDFGAGHSEPVRLVAAILTPAGEHSRHLTVLARLARILREGGTRERLLASPDPAGMARVLEEADDAAAHSELA